MRIWFDTEFLENGRTIDLISIGMVREDGATFYAETPVAKLLAESDDWLRENVRPHLKGKPFVMPHEEIAARIREFAGPSPEFWAYYAAYDWVAICQLYGRMIDLPSGWPMFVRDVQYEATRLNAKLPKQREGAHDALADAVYCRDAWAYLMGPATIAAQIVSAT